MDDRDLEVRVSARLHERFDDIEPSAELAGRVLASMSSATAGPIRLGWVMGGAAVLVLAVAAGVWISRPGPGVSPASPTPSMSPSPSTTPPATADRPYTLALETDGSPGPTVTISSPSDCDVLPTDWLQTFCGLTLRPEWSMIIGPYDPLGQPRSTTSVTWFAAMARATIDGDISLCSDVAMREWITIGSGLGGAPPPGSTPAPTRPTSECLTYLRTTAGKGTFFVTDPNGQANVIISVDPGAAANTASSSPPAFDPKVACEPTMERNTCGRLIDAVTAALGDQQGSVVALGGRSAVLPCSASASPCAAPSGGQWLGSVVVSLTSGSLAFDVADVGGTATAVQVPAP